MTSHHHHLLVRGTQVIFTSESSDHLLPSECSNALDWSAPAAREVQCIVYGSEVWQTTLYLDAHPQVSVGRRYYVCTEQFDFLDGF